MQVFVPRPSRYTGLERRKICKWGNIKWGKHKTKTTKLGDSPRQAPLSEEGERPRGSLPQSYIELVDPLVRIAVAQTLIAMCHSDVNQPTLGHQEATAWSKYRNLSTWLSLKAHSSAALDLCPAGDSCLQPLTLVSHPLTDRCLQTLNLSQVPAVCGLKISQSVLLY